MNATYAKEICCEVCAYLMDHPVDACPVCGEPFYWLIVTRTALQESQQTAFFQIMEDVVEGNIDRDFLQHGGHLWLPHNFWQYCPDGHILESFPWIVDVRQVQRPNPQKQKFFMNKPKSAEPISQAPEIQPEEPSPVEPEGDDTQPIPIMSPPKLERPQPMTQPEFVVVPNLFDWHAIFRPLMIALFFVFLAATYFSLLYHRNTRQPLPPQNNAEVTHEKQVLP